jgi:hypothetical protein
MARHVVQIVSMRYVFCPLRKIHRFSQKVKLSVKLSLAVNFLPFAYERASQLKISLIFLQRSNRKANQFISKWLQPIILTVIMAGTALALS